MESFGYCYHLCSPKLIILSDGHCSSIPNLGIESKRTRKLNIANFDFQIFRGEGNPEQVAGQLDRADQHVRAEREQAQPEVPLAHGQRRRPGM